MQTALFAANGQGIQQGLSGVFMAAITGVQHRAIDLL